MYEGGDIGIEESNEFLKRLKERRIFWFLMFLLLLGVELILFDILNVNVSERFSGFKRVLSDFVFLRCNSEIN